MSNVVKITASVGKNGQNKPMDNYPIQILLNKFIAIGCLKPTAVLAQDGVIGPKTIAAIKDFQHRIMGFSKPDGRVDPGGKTLDALNGPLIWAKPLAADKTFEWAIALRSIDSGKVEFSLVNRATGEQKSIAIRNPSISAVSISKSFAESWVTFKTFMSLAIGDFDNRKASFSKSFSPSLPYGLDLAGVGSFPVAPYPAASLSGICPSNYKPIFQDHGMMGPTMLGCELDSGSVNLGQTSMSSILGGVSPIPYPGIIPNPAPNLWVPPTQAKLILLSP